MHYDLLIKNGFVFDGLGAPPQQCDVGICNGTITKIAPNIQDSAEKSIDATGLWVLPGFIDIHTHYDLEVEIAPGLTESLRHGVTSIVMGNCSLSLTIGAALDLADIFLRVECLPEQLIRTWLSQAISWQSPEDYIAHLKSLAIAPNIAAMVGHSALRSAVMGLKRSLFEQPTAAELDQMCQLTEQALKAGCIGLSIDMVHWHKVSGDNAGRALPSHHARYHEFKRLCDVCRKYDAVVQITPDPLNWKTFIYIFWMSLGIWRAPLRLTLLSALDMQNTPKLWRLFPIGLFVFNKILGGNLRFQTLTEPFTIYGDGPITPYFEEFSAGVQLNNCKTSSERRALWQQKKFKEQFIRDWFARGPKTFHRKFELIIIDNAPDQTLIGKTVSEIAAEKNQKPIDCFIELLEQYDTEIRWQSTGANHRQLIRQRLVSHPHILPGFTDAGAHSRNIAFFDGALTLLKEALNEQFMTPEKAISRLTGEPASWFGLDAGVIAQGKTADIQLINPKKLTDTKSYCEIISDSALGGATRMVKRGSDSIIQSVIVNGQTLVEEGNISEICGKQKVGRVLSTTRQFSNSKEVHRAYRNRIADEEIQHTSHAYWPIFVLKHQAPMNRFFHCLALFVMYLIPAVALMTAKPLLLLALPVSQVIGLIGHALFERSHVDLRDLLFSWRAVFSLHKLFFLTLTGRYQQEIQRCHDLI